MNSTWVLFIGGKKGFMSVCLRVQGKGLWSWHEWPFKVIGYFASEVLMWYKFQELAEKALQLLSSEEDSDPEQAQKDKDMQKNLALIAKYFKKLYKPTNNNLRTSSNTRNKNVDTTPRWSSSEPSGIHCFNCKMRKVFKFKQSNLMASRQDEEIAMNKSWKHITFIATGKDSGGVLMQTQGTDTEPLEQDDQNDVECDDERVALANLIANLKLDVDENKKIQKQLKKANATLTQELTECKSILAETSRTLGESNSIRDSCLVALQNKQTEFERYKAFNDRTVDYDKLEHKLNEALGLLAQKEIDIKEGLKVKACEISIVKEKHDELVKQSLLTKSHYEGLVKEKTKVITDLKLKEEKDIDKMISMENQIKFLNEIVYKRSQSIQTIHMLAPKCPTFNGRSTFANPRYLKKAQYEHPGLYAITQDQSDPATRLIPDREEILTLAEESRSKLNKDLVKPFDYIKLNSLYEIFKPPTQHYEIQFAQANEIRKKMWRKSFVKTKPNIFKNIDFLPVSKSVSKSRQAYNVMTNNINHLKEIVNQAWVKHSNDLLHLRNPTAQDMEILVKTCLMPLALKTQNDSFAFVHELKQEMHADLKYVESLEDELDELESDKAEFSNMYDMLLQECVSKDVMCSYLQSSSDLDEITELQCLYLHKVREYDCLAQKLSEQTEFERKQYFEIQDLKAQLQDKNIAISELKKLIEKCKGKSMDSKFDKPSVIRQPNAQRIPKPSVLGKLALFSDSIERKYFAKKKSVLKTNKSEGLSKPVTPQNLHQTATQAIRNTNVIKPGMYRIASSTTQTRAPQLNQTSRNTNPRISTSTGVAHKTNVSRPQPRSNQMKDKVVPNTSHVKFKKTEVEEHPRISSISNQTKSVTACNDSLNSTTLNVNAVCATCGKCMFNSNHDACVSKFLKDVNTRTKKPNVVPISTRKPKNQANKSVAKPHKKTVASESTITNSKSYYRMFRLFVQLHPIIVDSGMHKDHDGQSYLCCCNYVKDQLCSSYEVSKVRRSSFKSKTVLSSKGRLNLLHMDLCGPMRVASINGKKYILNGIVERQNRTLVEAARTMLSASKLPLFFWAEAIATACYTQNRSIIIPNHEKTFTRVCENLDKMKEKEDLCILWAYSTQSKGIACYNSKNKVDVESIYLRFDEDQRDVRELSVLMNHFMASFPIRQRTFQGVSQIPLDEIHIDDKLHFVEEPVEILDREVKKLRRSRIPIIKVRWNSKRGPEFTWEREDQFREKYPHLFTKTAPSKNVAS
ncbi:integrase, catalytic region, zinc finger, CCHC-type containing protein [Tanacetum coccineum]